MLLFSILGLKVLVTQHLLCRTRRNSNVCFINFCSSSSSASTVSEIVWIILSQDFVNYFVDVFSFLGSKHFQNVCRFRRYISFCIAWICGHFITIVILNTITIYAMIYINLFIIFSTFYKSNPGPSIEINVLQQDNERRDVF